MNIPGQSFRALVKYKNIGSLHFRIIKVTESLKKELEKQYDEKYWPAIISATPLKSWQQNLPATNDLQQHSTEVKIEGLPIGEYLLAASSDKDFDGTKTILGARLFYVSAISYTNNTDDFLY